MNNNFFYRLLDWSTYKFPHAFRNDESFIKLRWKFQNPNSYSLNLESPSTFNEKLNWLKLNCHNPLFNIMADKYLVKDFVARKIGSEYVVPCYGVYDSFDDIDFEKLPNRFVMKSTHDSSGVVICQDKLTFDIASARTHFKKSLSRNWFWPSREWVYKNIKPRIIIDKYLGNDPTKEIQDYKFWCFNGKPIYMYITNKGKNINENFYDMNFSPVDINHGFPRQAPEFSKPEAFEEMKELAQTLSSGIPFVRVDFFYVDGKVYFGEYTFYDWGGQKAFASYEQDKSLGDLIIL